MADMSSVSGQDAFLGGKAGRRHIEYFQGLEKFHEPGLPCELPIAVERALEDDPVLRKTEEEVGSMLGRGGISSGKTKSRVEAVRQKIRRRALRKYQEKWVQDRRDQIILS